MLRLLPQLETERNQCSLLEGVQPQPDYLQVYPKATVDIITYRTLKNIWFTACIIYSLEQSENVNVFTANTTRDAVTGAFTGGRGYCDKNDLFLTMKICGLYS